MTVILQAKNISKIYQDGRVKTPVLSGLDLTIHRREKVAIVGSSGSGKSTLLHLLGGLDIPTTGEVWIDGVCLTHLNETQRGNLRNEKLGFVYQFHHLLAEFSATENVALPLLMRANVSPKQATDKANILLEQVGLSHRSHHRPSELSGGERQRVAIARALVTEPNLVLADEPTGNLDDENAHAIFELLSHLQDTLGMALLMVTHDKGLATKADRVLEMKSGHWVV